MGGERVGLSVALLGVLLSTRIGLSMRCGGGVLVVRWSCACSLTSDLLSPRHVCSSRLPIM